MSHYTTGELANRSGISVRTVQYYDKKGLLTPSAKTEGGRRLYTQSDLERLEVILFLKDLNFSLKQIKQIFEAKSWDKTLSLLLDTQEILLEEELVAKRSTLKRMKTFKSTIKFYRQANPDYLRDRALLMHEADFWNVTRLKLIGGLVGLTLTYLLLMLLAIYSDYKWLMFVTTAIYLVSIQLLIRWYLSKVNFLCPICHCQFRPTYLKFTLAHHTPRTRKLLCPHCQGTSYCLEVVAK